MCTGGVANEKEEENSGVFIAIHQVRRISSKLYSQLTPNYTDFLQLWSSQGT